MNLFGKKCDLPECTNKLSKDPYTLVVEAIDGEVRFTLCDECGVLMENIRVKYEEAMNDMTRSDLDE